MSAMDMFWAAPPVARTLTAATVLISVPAYLIGIPDLYYMAFIPQYVFTFRMVPQLWRLLTNFFISGPKFGMLLDPYFLFTYCSALETTAVRFSQPGDFFVYLVFCSIIILLSGGTYLGAPMLLSSLTEALAYTYAQENPNMQLNYFIVTFSAKWLPYMMLGMTLIMANPYAALVQATGLFAAHAYDFLAIHWPQHGGGRKLIWTPAVVAQAFAGLQGTTTRRGAGTAFNARPAGSTPGGAQNVPQRPAGGSGGWASGFSGGAWGERGAGRRLGGD